jgi:hypothetical protein
MGVVGLRRLNMMSGNSPGKELVDHVASVLSSPVLNLVVGMAGIATPLIAWASRRAEATGIVLATESTLLLCVVVSHAWLRRSHALVRRPAARRMSDPAYFDLVRRQIESDVVAEFEELADGHLTAYAGDSVRLVTLLLRTLAESPTQPKLALATDLVAPPGLLAAPAEYLGENRRLVEAGGEIRRILISWAADLADEPYSRELLELVDSQRAMGVQCGLVVRDNLRPDQAVDFLVVSRAAVSVLDDRGDLGRTRGRNSVHFKNVDRWVQRHESMWGHGAHSAASKLAAYEITVRPILASGSWDKDTVKACIVQL